MNEQEKNWATYFSDLEGPLTKGRRVEQEVLNEQVIETASERRLDRKLLSFTEERLLPVLDAFSKTVLGKDFERATLWPSSEFNPRKAGVLKYPVHWGWVDRWTSSFDGISSSSGGGWSASDATIEITLEINDPNQHIAVILKGQSSKLNQEQSAWEIFNLEAKGQDPTVEEFADTLRQMYLELGQFTPRPLQDLK